jgi:hypothetical protein
MKHALREPGPRAALTSALVLSPTRDEAPSDRHATLAGHIL